ncbi:MAG TPA: hypothetical protein VE981_10655 [Planctomycetota bacterium]|nr:hypothetical protein [Planctomycetota bacterium]
MAKLVRASFSIEKPLYDAFEKSAKAHGYANHSEYIRAMIRKDLVTTEWKEDQVCLGTITLVYVADVARRGGGRRHPPPPGRAPQLPGQLHAPLLTLR